MFHFAGVVRVTNDIINGCIKKIRHVFQSVNVRGGNVVLIFVDGLLADMQNVG